MISRRDFLKLRGRGVFPVRRGARQVCARRPIPGGTLDPPQFPSSDTSAHPAGHAKAGTIKQKEARTLTITKFP